MRSKDGLFLFLQFFLCFLSLLLFSFALSFIFFLFIFYIEFHQIFLLFSSFLSSPFLSRDIYVRREWDARETWSVREMRERNVRDTRETWVMKERRERWDIKSKSTITFMLIITTCWKSAFGALFKSREQTGFNNKEILTSCLCRSVYKPTQDAERLCCFPFSCFNFIKDLCRAFRGRKRKRVRETGRDRWSERKGKNGTRLFRN